MSDSIFSYYKFDNDTFIVIYNGKEFCVCSNFEDQDKSAEERAKEICEKLNQ
jgi:hypothetical protein